MAAGPGLRDLSWLRRTRLFEWTRASDASYITYLQRAAANPDIRLLRERAREQLRLQPSQRVADIGCGPGTLIVEFAREVGGQGRVVGIDRDRSMVTESVARLRDAGVSAWTSCQLADCAALPFRTAAFDACYCERLLQHVRDPAPAIAEALRVLVSGGRLVIADTDWTTLSIQADETSLAQRMAAAHYARFPNPSSGGRLERLCIEAGAVDITTEAFAVTIMSESATGLMTPRAQAALMRRALSRSERIRWRASMARARAEGLPYGQVTMIVAAATNGKAIGSPGQRLTS